MLYNPPTGATGPNDRYVGKIIAAGQQGSKIPPAVPEYTQREIVAAIAAAGLAPTNDVLVQVAMALSRGVFVGPLTGTGDLAVATLGVVFPSLLQGMRIGGVATAANTVTNPKLRVVNLGTAGLYVDLPILKEDGSALAAGDIKVGRLYRYEADGAGNVLISGGGIGGTTGDTIINQLAGSNARLRLRQQNNNPDCYYDANAYNNYQVYDANATDLGSFSIPAGYVCIDIQAVCFVDGGQSDTNIYLAIHSNDGSGWTFQESQRCFKAAGKAVILSRPALLSLDPTKAYQFTCRVKKDTATQTQTLVSGNLLGLAFKF